MQYVLVGGPFEIIDTPHKIEVFGEPVEIPEDLARSAILAGANVLPKDQFDTLGFTPDELKQYTNSRVQANAPKEFHGKHAAALAAARAYREQLASAPPAAAEAKSKKDKS